ncbi:restriction endonuclease subunit S [Dietzia maris]|uniref:restriction endonuclease subunit S n=1 Tax=Dietzia maris TaxID=37915 RepID=UPI0037CA9433
MTNHIRFKYIARNIVEKSDGTPAAYIGLEHVAPSTGHLTAEPEEKAATDSLLAQPGDILFGKLRPYLAKSLRVDQKLTCTGEFLVLRPNPGFHAPFIEYFTRSQPWLDWASASSYGSKMPRTSWDFLGGIEAYVPSMAIQRNIANFLDRETAKIDALIDKQKQLIATLREEADALWSAEVGRITESSPTMPLRRVIDSIVDGPFGSSLTSAHYSSEGARVIRLGNIGIDEFKDVDHAFIPLEYAHTLFAHEALKGDVVVAGLGDEKMPLGRAALVPDIGPAIVKADCYRIRPRCEQMRPDFLAWILSAPPTRKQIALLARGSTRARLNTTLIKEVEIPVPSLPIQELVVSRSRKHRSRINNLVSRAELLSDTLREYRSALITDAVTGKIDVREAV